MPFNFKRLEIPDVILISPEVFGDDRGFFMETYKQTDFRDFGINENFNQDNHSKSARGVLRGLHYQLPPHEQGKLVRCIRGKIFDVAVDIRKKSPTFGRWVAEELGEDNKKMLYIPPGFAHGFYTMSPEAEIVYKATSVYSPSHDRSLRWDDPEINISWPAGEVLLSDKDSHSPYLKDAEVFDL